MTIYELGKGFLGPYEGPSESTVVTHDDEMVPGDAVGMVTIVFGNLADAEGLQRMIDAECALDEQAGLPAPPLLRDLYKAIQMELDGLAVRRLRRMQRMLEESEGDDD